MAKSYRRNNVDVTTFENPPIPPKKTKDKKKKRLDDKIKLFYFKIIFKKKTQYFYGIIPSEITKYFIKLISISKQKLYYELIYLHNNNNWKNDNSNEII